MPRRGGFVGDQIMRWAWLCLAAAVVLGPNVVVVADGVEAWPWTCAPMFAESHHDDTAFYAPRVVIETSGGDEPFSSRPLRISDWHFYRLLLVEAYGAMSPSSPFGHVPGDTPAAFEARLDAFFDAVVENHGKPRKKQILPASARALRLEIEQVIPAPSAAAAAASSAAARADGAVVHVVGRYDLATRTFRWEPR